MRRAWASSSIVVLSFVLTACAGTSDAAISVRVQSADLPVATLYVERDGTSPTRSTAQPAEAAGPTGEVSPTDSTVPELPTPSTPSPEVRMTQPGSDSCDPNYVGACVPLVATDLDCGDIKARVQVVGTDIHGFDRDRDGFGCETYG